MAFRLFDLELVAILLPVIVVAAAFADNDFSAASLVNEAEKVFEELERKHQGNYQLGLLADFYDRLGERDKSKNYYELLVERAYRDEGTAINGLFPSDFLENTLIRFHRGECIMTKLVSLSNC